ncbi:MAG: SdpI family protein [Ferruginibacter sp.]
MNRFKLLRLVFPFILMAIPFAYLAYIWADLPQKIPTHFDLNGLPDKFGNKPEIFVLTIILAAVGIVIYFLLQNIHRVDPKKKYAYSTLSVMIKLSVLVILLLTFVSIIIIYSTLKGKITTIPFMFCGISIFLAFIGNLMHSIKPNYFAGIRVPWTLENEDNWRQTHQLASKIWFAGGLTLAVLSLLLKLKILIFVFLAAVVIMGLVPVIYSYLLYKKTVK